MAEIPQKTSERGRPASGGSRSSMGGFGLGATTFGTTVASAAYATEKFSSQRMNQQGPAK